MKKKTAAARSAGGCRVLDTASVVREFPILAEKPGTIFFDNASTSQKPASVIDAVSSFYGKECSNGGHSYPMAKAVFDRCEETRRSAAEFIGARPEDVVVTSGATASLNAIAYSWGLANLRDGDEVIVCLEDHKSTVLPWLNLRDQLRRLGRRVKVVGMPLNENGMYNLEALKRKLSDKTRLVAISHVHQIYGHEMEVEKVRRIVGRRVLLSVDASQSVGRRLVDVKRLGADFLSFSGHKMFAATGVGILYVAPRAAKKMTPFIVGGGTPACLGTRPRLDTETLQAKLESGTPDISAIFSLKPAIEYVNRLGIETIAATLAQLTGELHDALASLPGIVFAAGMNESGSRQGCGILSFRFEQAAMDKLSAYLADANILVKSGAQAVAGRRSHEDLLRVSMHVYNRRTEIDQLIKVLASALR